MICQADLLKIGRELLLRLLPSAQFAFNAVVMRRFFDLEETVVFLVGLDNLSCDKKARRRSLLTFAIRNTK